MRVHSSPLNLTSVLLVVVPLLLIDVGMIVYCIGDLYKPERRVYFFSKDVWAVIIILNGILFGFFYLLYGRENA